MDRRTILIGVGAVGLMGCGRADGAATQATGDGAAFASAMQAIEARYRGRIGISAHTPDHRVNWRSEERFVYCSSFKMFLAAATLLRVQAGQEQLDRAIPITRADMINHAPVTEPAIGRSLTIAQLMQGTVEVSDNPAANILIREMGGLDVLRAFYRGIGDAVTRVDRLEPEMNRWDGDKDTITPAQSAANLDHLLVSDQTPLDARSKALLLGWMLQAPTGAARIKAGVPAGWSVAHKTGTGGYGPTIDIGVIQPPAGSPIVMSIYFHGTRESTEDGREAAIADATRAALLALGVTG